MVSIVSGLSYSFPATQADTTTGLLAFKAACTGCTIDAYALHWYESATNIGYFKGHITNATSLLKGNLYVTEFAPTTGSDADKAKFFSSVVPWLDSQSFIERYAAFGKQTDEHLRLPDTYTFVQAPLTRTLASSSQAAR